MAETTTLTLTDFLLARIAEDEADRVTRPRQGYLPTPREVREANRWEAECEAKRLILDEHSNAGRSYAYCRICRVDEAAEDWPCPTLRALAAIYADHPDFNPDWA